MFLTNLSGQNSNKVCDRKDPHSPEKKVLFLSLEVKCQAKCFVLFCFLNVFAISFMLHSAFASLHLNYFRMTRAKTTEGSQILPPNPVLKFISHVFMILSC